MNKNKTNSAARRSLLSRQLLIEYFSRIFIYIGVLVLLYFFAAVVLRTVTWYSENPLYQFLKLVERTTVIWGSLLVAAGTIVIAYRVLSKPLGYLDEVVSASKQLAQPSNEPITLPYAMRDTQNELNLVREQAMRNAAAAKEAEQRKNDLIVYLAHDLKTPLTSVIGYLTLLRDEPQISPELRGRYTGIALNKAQRLEDLINEFFDITRFNLTNLTLDMETVNLTRMLEQITNEFTPVLMEKSLTWDTTLAPDVQISCDSDKLERVFDNLFRNAINYSYPEASIALSLVQEAENIVIQVKNRGKTIPPETLSRIFEQFFRLDSSRASATGGAGLGLAIAKEIVELHGGSITAESGDESITFTVTLPSPRQKNV